MATIGTLVAQITGDTSGLRRAERDAKKHCGGIENSLKSMKRIAITAFAGWGISRIAKSIGSLGMTFDRSMSIVKVTSRATATEFIALSDAARKMGQQTEFSAAQSADALKYLAMAGLSVNQQLKALPQMLNLATAGQLDLAYAADLSTNIMTQMGLKVEELVRVNDALAATASTANTNIQEMGQAFVYAGAKARAFDVDIEELSAMIGMLANAGIKAMMAGTTIRQSMSDIIRSVADPGGIKGTILEEHNIKVIDESTGKLRSYVEVLKDLADANLGTVETSQLFGARAINISLILDQGSGALQRYIDRLKSMEGIAQEMADTIREDVRGAYDSLLSVIGEYGLRVWDEYRDSVKAAFKIITQTMRAHFGDIDKAAKRSKEFLWDFAESAWGAFDSMRGVFDTMLEGLKTLGSAIGLVIKLFNTLELVARGWMAAFAASEKGGSKIAEFWHKSLAKLTEETANFARTLKEQLALSEDHAASKTLESYADKFDALADKARVYGAAWEVAAGKVNDGAQDNIARIEELQDALLGLSAAPPSDKNVVANFREQMEIFTKFIVDFEHAYDKVNDSVKEFIRYDLDKSIEQLIGPTKDAASSTWDFAKSIEENSVSMHNAKKGTDDLLFSTLLITSMWEQSTFQVERLTNAQQASLAKLEAFLQVHEKVGASARAIETLNLQYEKFKTIIIDLELPYKEMQALLARFAQAHKNDLAMIVDDTKVGIQSILSDIESLDFKGTSFGNELADGINNAVISMQSLNDLFNTHAKIQENINKLADTGEKLRAQQALDAKKDDYFQAQISGYRQLFGTVSQLFKENSKEREVLHKAEIAFAVLELAMSAKKMAMDAAGTVAAITNSAKRCVAWGVEAVAAAVAGIAGQATGDPYTAFARVAAMIALMGSVLAMAGKAFGGGGGSSGGYSGTATSTTGTVLGAPEESSESLQHSLDLMEEYHAEDYTELVGIHNEMKDLNDNITGLVANIVRGFGTFEGDGFEWSRPGAVQNFFESFGEGAKKFYQEFWGTLGLDFMGEFIGGIADFMIGDVLGSLYGSIFGGKTKVKLEHAGIALGREQDEKGKWIERPKTVGDILAGDPMGVAAYYDIYKKTSGGLLGSTKRKRWTEYEAVEPDIERLFNKIYENISNMLVYLAEGFNVSAEDMAAVLAYEFEAMEIDLKGLTGAEITEKINAWISTLGDTAVETLFSDIVGKYQEIDEGMLETAMRLIAQKEILFSAMEMTNVAFDDTSTSAIDFSQALIAIGGEFEDLIDSISNYYDKFFTDIEKHQDLMEELTSSLAQQDLILPRTREGYRALVEGLDLTTESGMKAYVTLMNAASAADTYYDRIEDIFENIEDSIQSVFDDITMEGMDQYTTALYEINQKYKTYAEDLESIGRLYDEQGNLTDIATRAMSTYNLEIQRLANTILDTIRDIQRQLATMGMESGQASMLGIASRYGVAPSVLQSAGQDILSWYAQADPQAIAEALIDWGVSIDQFNADIITLGNYFLNQSETHHQEAQATRNEIINSLDSAISGIDSMLADLSPTGKYAPVQSAEAFQFQYEKLIEQIRTSGDPGQYVSQLQSFLPDYMSFMGAYGGDYKDLVTSVQADLEGLNIELKTERDYLQEIAGSSGATATNTASLLNLGIPITFNTIGLGSAAVAFLQGLQEIVRLVGWNSPFTIDFVSNYTGFTTMPFDDFVNVLSQVATKVPGGWYAPITMDMIMSFENWDDTSIDQKLASWNVIKDVYGWHSPVTFEFMVDMVDTGTVSWADIDALIPDDITRKELIMYLNNQTGMSSEDLSNIFGKDTVANMHIGAELIWPNGGYLDVVIGNAVTIAKFGNINADDWSVALATGVWGIWDEVKRIANNTASLSSGFNFPSYVSGGLTHGRSFAGESGDEWVVPTYEPQRSSFLKDVGADPEEIGKVVARHLLPLSQTAANEGQEIHVHLDVDSQEICKPIIIGLRGRNVELIEATRRVTR